MCQYGFSSLCPLIQVFKRIACRDSLILEHQVESRQKLVASEAKLVTFKQCVHSELLGLSKLQAPREPLKQEYVSPATRYSVDCRQNSTISIRVAR